MKHLIRRGCFFLSVRSAIEKGSVRLLLRAALAWAIAALPLCLLAAAAVRGAGIGSAQLGYLSSALSFAAAAAAGAAGCDPKRRLRAGLLTGVFLSLLLLTAGFLIAGERLDSSGVLSVCCFSLAGCVFGSVLFGARGAETKRTGFAAKKKQKRFS